MPGKNWRETALAECASIKPQWSSRYDWAPTVVEADEHIDLLVRFSRAGEEIGQEKFVLRLRYQADYETAGRRESFLNPINLNASGREFWPEGSAFKEKNNPPAICLEGTYGFHSVLHRDRDGRRAHLNKLLMEIQQCLRL